jgi:hypothetical protein
MELADRIALATPREATIRIRQSEILLSLSDASGRPRQFRCETKGAPTAARLARGLLLHLAATFPWQEIPPAHNAQS